MANGIDLDVPELLHISLCQGGREALQVEVEVGETVAAGHPLASDGAGFVVPCPVPGTVKAISDQPDIRGQRKGRGVVIEPSAEKSPPAFEKLDPTSAAPDVLAQRLRAAGVLTSARAPRPLMDELHAEGEHGVDTVVVLAADRDPGVSVALQLLRERASDAGAAAALLGRIAGAGRVVLALCAEEAAAISAPEEVEILTLPAVYPETLAAMIARRIGGGPGLRVVSLEGALTALDAVRTGRVQETTLLTLIGPDQKPIANYRVPLGTPLRVILAHAGLEVGDRDKVVAGGPMRGFAVFSIDGAVDAGIDALTVIPAGAFPDWSTEPCVNCGRCIDICPVDLQVQLISRYAEFELFDRTVEFDIDQCFECGLCASVCTARRPLLQYIRLAKRGLEVSA